MNKCVYLSYVLYIPYSNLNTHPEVNVVYWRICVRVYAYIFILYSFIGSVVESRPERIIGGVTDAADVACVTDAADVACVTDDADAAGVTDADVAVAGGDVGDRVTIPPVYTQGSYI